MNALYIALVVAVVGPVILSYLSGKQRKAELAQTYKRQDDVAAEAKRQQDEVAAQVAKDREEQEQRQAEMVLAAEGVAQLLVEAEKARVKGTDEVARLAKGTEGVQRGGMIAITLSYPNENRENVLLAEVPRVGESIRLSNGAEDPWHIVEHVLWVEGTDPPHVIVSVRPNPTRGKD